MAPSNSPDWILSNPLAFTLQSGHTYYFGAIQDENTGIIAPFFDPPKSVAQHGLTTLDTGNSNYGDFILPHFATLAGASFPLQLYGTQGSGRGNAPEASLALLLACGLFVIVWRNARTAKR